MVCFFFFLTPTKMSYIFLRIIIIKNEGELVMVIMAVELQTENSYKHVNNLMFTSHVICQLWLNLIGAIKTKKKKFTYRFPDKNTIGSVPGTKNTN